MVRGAKREGTARGANGKGSVKSKGRAATGNSSTGSKRPGRAVAAAKPRKAYKAVLKTTKSEASVAEFLGGIADAQQRADCAVLQGIFAKAMRRPATMWGGAIVGYGDYSYVGRSGRAGDWFLGGFSPRKGTLTLYMLGGWAHDAALLAQLGRHKLGGGCLYLKRLADVDMKVLKALVASAHKRAKAIAPTMTNQGAH
jgi:hypothetical protein